MRTFSCRRFFFYLIAVLTLIVPSACATPDFEKDVPRREKGRFTQSFASPIALADQVDDPLVKR
ncbi:hypothetical protein, partial [Escherichia coli]|uniref:hypothetical protein n=1 Tax=Escherichia coli TaxID=562 RepID=UPI001BC8A3FA